METKKNILLFPQRKFRSKDWCFVNDNENSECVLDYVIFPISLFIWDFSEKNTVYDQEIFNSIPDDNWIISIRYPTTILRKDGYDAQIGCSGKLYRGETEQQGAIREMSEELGLVPKTGCSPKLWKGKHSYKIKDKVTEIENNVFCYSIDDVEPVTDSKNTYKPDVFDKRVFIIVHGSISEVENMLKKLKTVKRSKDAPWSVVAIPKKCVTYCVDIKRKNKTMHKYIHFV